MTTSDVGRLQRTLAAVLDWPELEQKQPSINVVTVKFVGSKGKWMGTRSVFLWGPGFRVINRRITRRIFLIWVLLGERLAAVIGKNCLWKAKGPFIESEYLMVHRDF